MPEITCNNTQCAYNEDNTCKAKNMSYIDRLCRTFRSERIKDIMQPSFRSRCHREGGKYKSDNGRLIK